VAGPRGSKKVHKAKENIMYQNGSELSVTIVIGFLDEYIHNEIKYTGFGNELKHLLKDAVDQNTKSVIAIIPQTPKNSPIG
jgi:hypothetical protein